MAINPKPLRKIQKQIVRIHHDRTGSSIRKIQKSFRTIPRLSSVGRSYILQGKKVVEVKFFLWALWYEHHEARKVKRTDLPGPVRVSTVFLGLDHSFGGRRPLYFETMIFGGDHDGYQDRYATYDEAVAGHQKAIEHAFKVDQ